MNSFKIIKKKWSKMARVIVFEETISFLDNHEGMHIRSSFLRCMEGVVRFEVFFLNKRNKTKPTNDNARIMPSVH